MDRNPRHPVYVISKGRWRYPYTVRALERRGIPFRLVVEPQEFDEYAKVVDPGNILVLPFRDLGRGSIPARNWVWEHALAASHDWHWILDDNIQDFYYLHDNIMWRTRSGFTFRLIEDFVERYENVAIAGMHYESMCPRKYKHPPLLWNTRVYSCILIRNDLPYRWRGKWNEDTDLSLRALKDGWVTVLFKAFLAGKIATMRLPGGNTDELYRKGKGRLKMALSLQLQHPDVARVTWRWGRWQHWVDYRREFFNVPRLKPGAKPLNLKRAVKFIMDEP